MKNKGNNFKWICKEFTERADAIFLLYCSKIIDEEIRNKANSNLIDNTRQWIEKAIEQENKSEAQASHSPIKSAKGHD